MQGCRHRGEVGAMLAGVMGRCSDVAPADLTALPGTLAMPATAWGSSPVHDRCARFGRCRRALPAPTVVPLNNLLAGP